MNRLRAIACWLVTVLVIAAAFVAIEGSAMIGDGYRRFGVRIEPPPGRSIRHVWYSALNKVPTSRGWGVERVLETKPDADAGYVVEVGATTVRSTFGILQNTYSQQRAAALEIELDNGEIWATAIEVPENRANAPITLTCRVTDGWLVSEAARAP